MPKRLAPLVPLVGIASLALVACGGDDGEATAPTVAAAQPQLDPTAVITPTPEPTRPAGAGITKRDGNVVEMTLTIVGGGGTTEPKSNTYGAGPFQWFPNEMTFKVGDTVNFTLIPIFGRPPLLWWLPDRCRAPTVRASSAVLGLCHVRDRALLRSL